MILMSPLVGIFCDNVGMSAREMKGHWEKETWGDADQFHPSSPCV